MIPNKVSAVLEVTDVPPMDTACGVVELGNKWKKYLSLVIKVLGKYLIMLIFARINFCTGDFTSKFVHIWIFTLEELSVVPNKLVNSQSHLTENNSVKQIHTS